MVQSTCTELVSTDVQLMLPEGPTATEIRNCNLCGGPLRRDNTSGYCRRTEACQRAGWNSGKKKEEARRKPVTCSRPRCPKPVRANGLCEMHYARVRKNGDPGPDERLTAAPTEVLRGQVFGLWTALQDANPSEGNIACRCICGTERRIQKQALLAGRSQSCGCQGYRPPPTRRPKVPYLTAGAFFGRLTLLEDATRSSDMVDWLCECGTVISVRASRAKSGNTKSCGCLQREVASRHGFTGHPLWQIWRGIIRRTSNPQDVSYKYYGGRGITVCERWQSVPGGFLNFIADVGERPPGMSLDRIDNDGSYEPGNVRWATPKQQLGNRRTVQKLTRERDELARKVKELELIVAELRMTKGQ